MSNETAAEPEFLISQSLIKAVKNCTDDNPTECSLVLKAKFIDNRFDLFPPSDAQNVGTWFEYMATGSLPKNGAIPQADMVEKGTKLAAPYRLMEKHVKNFKGMLAYYGLEILEKGTTIKANGLVGTIDVLLKATRDIWQDEGGEQVLLAKAGQSIIGDLKSTGLTLDKWSPYGWHLDFLHNKFNLILQPIHYKLIGRYKSVYGEDLPFWFFLFNTKDENDYSIIDFRVNEYDYEMHEALVANTAKWLRYFVNNGFDKKANPSVERCAVCPIRVGCKHFAVAPKVQVFHLSQVKDKDAI